MVRIHFAIVGGGITGLAAANRLVEVGREHGTPLTVRVLEASDRLGGHIRTERVGGYLLEAGPDTLLARKPAAARLCERIGLAREIVPLGGRNARTEVVRRGRLVRVPDGFLMMAPGRLGPFLRSPLLSLRGKVRMMREPWIAPRSDAGEDESLASFVERRFGREVLERVAEPIVAGLYTARAEDLSLKLTLPRFLEMERREGSVIRALRRAARAHGSGSTSAGGQGSFLALRGGLGRLTEELVARLPAGSVATRTPVETVRYDGVAQAWKVRCADGRSLEAGALVLACPAPDSSRMLRATDPDLAARLTELEYASCATVTLAYRRPDVGAPLRSFGFFVPRSEGLPLLACSYVSEKFEGRGPEDTVVLRAFLGGATRPDVLEEEDEGLLDRTHTTLARLLRVEGQPVLRRVHRFPGSMPQYRVGQARWIAEVRARAERHSGLFFAGSTVGALGLPDCIQSGEEAAECAIESVARRAESLRRAI